MLSKSKYYFAVIVLLSIAVISCAPALYKPLPEQSTDAATYNKLVKGRELYVSSCGSCHNLYLPEKYSEQVWVHNLDEMQVRAKISNEQKSLILAYLTSAPVKKVTSDK